MLVLDLLAEQRIREAQERGEFDGLPGAGAPLALDDDALVPEELRAGYRLLRNAGFAPPEVEALREIAQMGQMLDAAPAGGARERLHARISLLLAKSESGRRHGSLRLDARYFRKVAERLARTRRTVPG
jgi:hypothetical protein